MLEKIKNFSQILQQTTDGESFEIALSKFFDENFGVESAKLVFKQNYISENPIFELNDGNDEIIGYLECNSSTMYLKKFLNYTLNFIAMKAQNVVLSSKMQRAIDFQNSMKNIAKIIETQYELSLIIPLLGEMVDKFVQNHLVYIFVKTNDKFELMWPNACNETKIFDIINAKPLKRVTTNQLGVFPLLSDDKLLGYIVTKNLDERLTSTEIEYLDEISKQAAITINRANIYSEVLKHATLDALTGFYNRGELEERIKQEIASSLRQNTRLCVIMTDIDYFKSVNDTYGHAVGDLVLKQVSKIIRSQLREYDIAGRYGGEEFVILLPFTKLLEAKRVAQRLRKAIEKKNINIKDVNSSNQDRTINVTISSGVYEFQPDDTAQDFISFADEALYEAKNSGRNKVVVYDIYKNM